VAPKTMKSKRLVPVPPALRRFLLAHKLAVGRDGDDFLFGRSASEPFTPTAVRRRALQAWAAAAVGAFIRSEPLAAELAPLGLHRGPPYLRVAYGPPAARRFLRLATSWGIARPTWSTGTGTCSMASASRPLGASMLTWLAHFLARRRRRALSQAERSRLPKPRAHVRFMPRASPRRCVGPPRRRSRYGLLTASQAMPQRVRMFNSWRGHLQKGALDGSALEASTPATSRLTSAP
jgi:hypothetical protein